MLRVYPLTIALAMAALGASASPAYAQGRSLALSLDPIRSERPISQQALRSTLSQNLSLQYTGDAPTKAQVIVVTATGTTATNSWISDLMDLLPGETRSPNGPRPLPLPAPDILPNGGTPTASFSSWLPWPFSIFAPSDPQPEAETDGERKWRELEERRRRQNDPQHFIDNALQAGPPPGPNETSVVMAVVPLDDDGIAVPGQVRTVMLRFTGAR